MKVIEHLLDMAKIERGRVRLKWVSAAEGQLFANYIKELSGELSELGPFDPSKYCLQLAAIESVLNSPRVRWLIGIDRQVTERGNVYSEKVDSAGFEQTLRAVCEAEYQNGLILELLRSGPKTVQEICAATGLAVKDVSKRLVDVEKMGAAELSGYEGSSPRFMRTAA
jgi:hypothetical protein